MNWMKRDDLSFYEHFINFMHYIKERSAACLQLIGEFSELGGRIKLFPLLLLAHEKNQKMLQKLQSEFAGSIVY